MGENVKYTPILGSTTINIANSNLDGTGKD